MCKKTQDWCGSLRGWGETCGLVGGCGAGFCGLFAEGVADGDAKGVGDEVDVGHHVEFGLPVEGEVDRGVGEFIVEADGAGGTQVGVAVAPADVTAAAIEPGEGGDGADQLVTFVQPANAKAGTKRD